MKTFCQIIGTLLYWLGIWYNWIWDFLVSVIILMLLLELKYSSICIYIPINKRLSDFRPATIVKKEIKQSSYILLISKLFSVYAVTVNSK